MANVGDSRAVMSCENGVKVFQLSRDHKPLDEIENKRIQEAGGKIYQYNFYCIYILLFIKKELNLIIITMMDKNLLARTEFCLGDCLLQELLVILKLN